jgi:hypothetical protein
MRSSITSELFGDHKWLEVDGTQEAEQLVTQLSADVPAKPIKVRKEKPLAKRLIFR